MTSNLGTPGGALSATLPSERAGIQLQLIAKSCASGGCPTIYKSDHGTLIIQGYAVSAAQAGLELPDGELLVEIPVDLLTAVAGIVD